MTELRVWAPEAERVDAVMGEERVRMEPGAAPPPVAGEEAWAGAAHRTGWWRLGRALPAGTDYAFSLDGGRPMPDPRSPWQPYGVHGPSRTVDHREWRWTDGEWRGFHLPSAVLYELHPGTFTDAATLDGAIERLEHLVELGVTAVSLMPVNAFPGRQGWGYDGVALYAVHEPYGGPAALKRFVEACHARGLGVVLDVVYNHLGPSGNYLPEYGPYFTDRYHTPWGAAPNLDGAGSEEVRRFFLDNAAMWLRDYHVDGLRIDAVHAIVDTSAVHILEELAIETEALSAALDRPLWLIAESDLNDPRLLWSRERGGYGLHAQWSDDFHHALHAALTGERTGYYEDFGRIGHIAAALTDAYVYGGRHSPHRGRRHGRAATGLSGRRFLGYLQNHDQVGNRAAGRRIGELAGPELQKVGAALVLAAPFIPMLFQGEEWAASSPFQYFTNHPEPELAAAVREGRRGEFAAFGWDPETVPDPQDPATWLRSRLPWGELEQGEHRDMAAWYRALIKLRREHPALLDGRRETVGVEVDEDAGTLLMRRSGLVVAANLSGEDATVPLTSPSGGAGGGAGRDPGAAEETAAGAGARVLLASREGTEVRGGEVILPARSVVILAI
ncbi:MAG: malto-oligosyltrehalose trehalohydrolase [Gemmatimonadota bacterium]